MTAQQQSLDALMQDVQATSTIHQPVLLQECVELVTGRLRRAQSAVSQRSVSQHSVTQHSGHKRPPIIVDCTLGLAGHATAFLKAAPMATLVGIDRDEQALALATERIEREGLADRFIPVHAPFDQFSSALAQHHIRTVDAVFMDLGLSSLQIDDTERGFSYAHDAPLDMRMDTSTARTAADILATYDMAQLRHIFTQYGQEKFAGPIAKAIVQDRNETPFISSGQLVALVDRVVPKAHRPAGNPAKRVFQALRIEVNGELDKLRVTLPQAILHLAAHGRLVVESYHSLEDIQVKRTMNTGLVIDVPPQMPIVPEDAKAFFADLTRGALKADPEEIAHNRRSGSVRLRAVELIRPIPNKWKNRYRQEIAELTQ